MIQAKRWMQALALATALLGAQTAFAEPAKHHDKAPDHGIEITLLGTAGGPPPHMDRSQPATLLRVSGASYLIDSGENAGQQLMRAGEPPRNVTAAFITHLHWDHTLGLGYVMATGWMMGRRAPMPIYGPPGLAEYVDREIAALTIGEDIFRTQTPDLPQISTLYPVHEFDLTGPREIYKDANVRVTAVENSHFEAGEKVPRSYGTDRSYSYRFDTAQGSVTFTGDTGPSEAVAKLAEGSDVLVSEICDLEGIRAALEATRGNADISALMEHMEYQHLTPAEVGKLAAKAHVKKLVLTHFVKGRTLDAAKMVAEIRQFYPEGEIVVGHDLERVDLGRSSQARP